jgi:hypothetical protein
MIAELDREEEEKSRAEVDFRGPPTFPVEL